MKRGVLLFAFNSPKFNYYSMAEATANRINHFLDLPVTVVTDKDSIPENSSYSFDKTITVVPDKNNKRDNAVWINKGRYQAFEFSPYDETILLDTDYMVNSDKLLKTFELPTDFCCHSTTSLLMNLKSVQEVLSSRSFKIRWATVVNFKRTKRVEQIFGCMEMIQNNFNHYASIHGFISNIFRNDHALSLALRIVNGHMDCESDVIPWNLVHVSKNTNVYADSSDQFNTKYTVIFDHWHRSKLKKEYATIVNSDFHMLNKENFMDLIA